MIRTNSVALHRFDPDKDLDLGMTIVVIGRRRSGKTTAIRDILHSLRDRVEMGWVFCPTLANHVEFGKFMPSDFIKSELDLSFIQQIIQFQTKRIKKKTVKHVFIVIDDHAHNKKAMRSELINSLFTNGRHYCITVIIGLQYGVAITPEARRNADLVCMCRENTAEERKKLFDGYTDGFNDKNEFAQVMDEVCVNHQLLVFNKTKRHMKTPAFYWLPKYPCPAFIINRGGYWWKRKTPTNNHMTASNSSYNVIQTSDRSGRPGRRFFVVREDNRVDNAGTKNITVSVNKVQDGQQGVPTSKGFTRNKTNYVYNTKQQEIVPTRNFVRSSFNVKNRQIQPTLSTIVFGSTY